MSRPRGDPSPWLVSFLRARPGMEKERISPAETPRQGEQLVRPITRLCVELEALCGRADPILTRMDHVCEQLPRLLRRVATPW